MGLTFIFVELYRGVFRTGSNTCNRVSCTFPKGKVHERRHMQLQVKLHINQRRYCTHINPESYKAHQRAVRRINSHNILLGRWGKQPTTQLNMHDVASATYWTARLCLDCSWAVLGLLIHGHARVIPHSIMQSGRGKQPTLQTELLDRTKANC